MKKRIKKTIALLTLTVAILGTSMTSFAASCLNVRDYGRHRHNHRVEYVQKNYELVGMTRNEAKFRVKTITKGFCVCGEYGTDVDYSFESRPVQ